MPRGDSHLLFTAIPHAGEGHRAPNGAELPPALRPCADCVASAPCAPRRPGLPDPDFRYTARTPLWTQPHLLGSHSKDKNARFFSVLGAGSIAHIANEWGPG